MPNVTRLVFDTNVCGRIAASETKLDITKHLRREYRIAASANTIFELLLGVCRSKDDAFLDSDKERFRIAFGYGALGTATFLDHGLSFALWHGPKLRVAETSTGNRLFGAYTKLVLQAKTLEQLRKTGVRWYGSKGRYLKCDVIEDDIQNGKLFYSSDIMKPLPDALTWARDLATVIGLNLKNAQAKTLSDSLDGLYTYERWLRSAVPSGFDPAKNANDRMDMNQLFYLSDPSVEFITAEVKIRQRIAASPQAKRVVLLNELLARHGLSL